MSGQLGSTGNFGVSIDNPFPTQASGGPYARVLAGFNHTLALAPDGGLWAWGSNLVGELGTGGTTNSATPAQVGTDPYVQATGGAFHTLALRADGSVWSWGSNFSGALGRAANSGTGTANPTPGAVAGGPFTQVATGFGHSLARRADGTLWTWGSNANGQLGLGTAAAGANPTPTQEATGSTAWAEVMSGHGNFSLARTASAFSFASAGLNVEGQLGDGTRTQATRFDRPRPLPVELVSFEARRTGASTVQLTWATASEVSNAGFGIEKSINGQRFQRLAFVAGAGRSTTARAYAYPDAATPAAAYYRLAQQDLDGTLTYSPVRYVPAAAPGATAASALVLLPNPAPAGPVQTLTLPAGATLTIYDALGRRQRPPAATLDAAGLPPGLYLVRATAPGQPTQTARLLVE